MGSMCFLGQLSSLLWIAFFVIASVRIFITIKDSKIFTSKN